MRLVSRSVLPLSLLLIAGGLAVTACGPTTEDPFARGGDSGGGHGDDDDDGHSDPDDRWGTWDLVRTAPFGDGTVEITSTVSFFTEGAPIAWPQPGGLDDCIVGSLDDDPHAPPESSTDYGVPTMFMDGEEWEVEWAPDRNVYSRVLPERVWVPFDLVTLSVPGTDLYPATSWDEALSIPETLVGTSAMLTEDGLELEWEGGAAGNQLRLIIGSWGSGRYEHLICLPDDDGSFTVPVDDMLDTFEGWDIEVRLQRETRQDNLGIDETRTGTTFGISALKAEFSIAEGYWTDEGDDDDDSAR